MGALIEVHMPFMDAQRMKESTLNGSSVGSGLRSTGADKTDCMAASGNLDHWEFVRERFLSMPEAVVRPKPLLTGRG